MSIARCLSLWLAHGIAAGLFLFPGFVSADQAAIVINEIAAFEPSDREWLEVVNDSGSSISLDGWKFWEAGTNHSLALVQGSDSMLGAGEYAIIAQDAAAFLLAYPSVTVRTFDSSWGSLSESGEEIGIKDASGVFIEQFTFIAASNHSLERKDASSADYTSANWFEHPTGATPGQENRAFSATGTSGGASAAVVINEIIPNPASGGKEWVELYNTSPFSGDVNGWTIADDTGGTIASATTTIAAQGFLVIELSSARLNNSGDTVRLKNASGAVIDVIHYGTSSGNAPVPAQGNALARREGGADTDNDAADIIETTQPTPGAANAIAPPALPASSPSSPSPVSAPVAGSSLPQSFFPRDVVLNEFAIAGGEDGEEWIELFNATGNTISLDGWRVDEGGDARTAISGSVGAKGFFVIEKPSGALNNAGDMVSLYDPSGRLIDRVSYGSWNDGAREDNAPVAGEGAALARIVDGKDTDDDKADFAATSLPTKASANVIAAIGPNQSAQKAGAALLITEIFPNPAGSDAADEFVEVKNTGVSPIDMAGWMIGDETEDRYVIATTTVVAPYAYRVFRRAETGIALDNGGGDAARLLRPDGTLQDRAAYAGDAAEGRSFARRADGRFGWTASSTPNRDNVFFGVNMPPIISLDQPVESAPDAAVVFDASDTVDPERDRLSYLWDFGDGAQAAGDTVSHAFSRSGAYTVFVSVADAAGNTSTKKWTLTVRRPEDAAVYMRQHVPSRVVIGEFLPNPAESEDAEYIEVKNTGAEAADISGYFLDDEDGGSSPYRIPNGTVLAAGASQRFFRSVTRIALNNSDDAVRLLSPAGETVDERSYDTAASGQVVGSDGKPVAPSAVKGIKIGGATTLEEARLSPVGARVRVEGTVAVLPGVFGTQYFYIVGSPGIQVYMNKKDFPPLALGDRVAVAGEIREAGGEKRVKTKQKSDISVVSRGAAPAPEPFAAADVGDDSLGALVVVTGEITDRKSTMMYLDDGTDEIEVYFKQGAGIRKDALKLGDRVAVTGILVKGKAGFRLLPRSQKDIAPAAAIAGQKILRADGGETRSRPNAYTAYLTASALVLASALILLSLKHYRDRFFTRDAVAALVKRVLGRK